MRIRIKLISCFLLLSFSASTQNLTGTWEGNSGNYNKLVILQINDSCFGYTYDTGFGHCKANFIGTYNELSKKLVGLNTSFIEKHLLHTLSRYYLVYSTRGGSEYLTGRIGPKNGGMSHDIWYKKTSVNVDTTKLMAAKVQYQAQLAENKAEKKNEEIPTVKIKDSLIAQKIKPVPDLSSVKESRTSTLLKTLETEADSIRLVLYDNGEIDGDTVTVFYNGTIIFNSVLLSVKPMEITLAVNKNKPLNTIELMANNLGNISPNTALLLIYTGKDRHELRVSSDYSTNARIDIRHIESHR